jgi:glycosyltransferase involved in cell wall biosynthesis
VFDGIVLALGGLGFIFRSSRVSAKILRMFIVPIFRLFLANVNVRFIIQNRDDGEVLKSFNIANSKKIRLIRGAGVSVKDFFPKNVQNEIPLVILPARMLWDKGVEDFVNCAQRFYSNKVSVRFALIGNPDPQNPESIPDAQLKQWVESGIVEWWGNQENMLKIYHMTDIVCFPSYHEGFPKALLEAASCELPIVAYDVSGCREIVKDNVNGFLVPFKDENALFVAVLELLENPKLRGQLGKMGRKMVIEEFTQEKIASETIKVWGEISK